MLADHTLRALPAGGGGRALDMALSISWTRGVHIRGGSRPMETTQALIADKYILTVEGASPWSSRYPTYLSISASLMGRGEIPWVRVKVRNLFTAAPYPVLLLGAHPAEINEAT